MLEFAVSLYLSNLHNTVIDNETKKGAEKILWRKRYYGNLFARKVKPNSFSMKSGPGKKYYHNSKFKNVWTILLALFLEYPSSSLT